MSERMRIAVVDDNPTDRERLVKCLSALETMMEVRTFESGSDFLRENGLYDLVVLDIDLKDEDGISISSLVSEKASALVYFTFSSARMQEAFAYKTVGYLLKSQSDEEITAALQKIPAGYRKDLFTLRTDGGMMRIHPSRILCVRRENRKLFFYLYGNETVRAYDLTMEECLEKLACLARVNKSELVNLDQLSALKRNEIVLMDGTVMVPSRIYFDKLQKQFLERRM